MNNYNVAILPGMELADLSDEALVVLIQETRARLAGQVLPLVSRRDRRTIETASRLLYERHERPLIAYLYGLCKQRPMALEIYQESWLRIWNHIDDWEPRARFATLLYRVAKNCLSDVYFRKEQKRLFVTTSLSDEEAPELSDEAAHCAADFHLEHSRAEAAYRHCLEQLPMPQREAFLLTRERELTAAEIGDITGAGREAVKSRIRYAIAKLRDCIGTRTGA